MEASTEWKISAPHPPQISEFFVWDSEGAQKCFILHDQTTGDLKSHHLQALATLTALSVPPRPPFLSAEKSSTGLIAPRQFDGASKRFASRSPEF